MLIFDEALSRCVISMLEQEFPRIHLEEKSAERRQLWGYGLMMVMGW
jgi:hypothetical protein